jgi:DNA-binding LacI/PurR family transcriptional regulator
MHLSYIVIDDEAGYGLQRQLVENQSLGGFVFMVDMLDRKTAEWVAGFGRPSVVVNEEQFSDLLTCIVADEEQGIADAVQYLVGLGHRKIAFVWIPHQPPVKYLGYQRGLKANGIELDSDLVFTYEVMRGSPQQIEGAKLARKILEKRPDCTAVITGSSEFSIGLEEGFAELGVPLGERVSVIGFGMLEKEFNLVEPGKGRLSTIAKPRYELGRCAAEVLLQQMKNGYNQSGLIKLKTKLLIGESTGPAPA